MVRIRKNSTLSPLLFCSYALHNDDLRPRVCKLNQSPWDAIVPSLLDSSHKLEAEDGLYVNSNLGPSIVAKESVASPMEIEEKPDTALVLGSASTDCNGYRRCQRNNGKSWRCNKEASEGVLLCEYHYKRKSRRNVNYCIDANENNNINTTTSNDTADLILPLKKAIVPAKELAGIHRVRPKVVAKKGETALKNPYEFYYYSGFGRRWGRNRDISEHKMEAKFGAENVGATPSTTTQISKPESHPSHKIDNGVVVDYIEDNFDDDDEEEDGGGECGRKRMRRHVKARSLKSLMQ